MKNKLKICFENLKSQTWKSSRTEKEKKKSLTPSQRSISFTRHKWMKILSKWFEHYLENHCLVVKHPLMHQLNGTTITHAFCNAHVNQFFKIIFIFIKLSNCTLYNLIVTKKKSRKYKKNTPRHKLNKFWF
jgi:hypothetical protein